MFHYNKQEKYKQLFQQLRNIISSTTIEMLYFSHGCFVGWACRATDYNSKKELDRLLDLAENVTKQRKKQIKG